MFACRRRLPLALLALAAIAFSPWAAHAENPVSRSLRDLVGALEQAGCASVDGVAVETSPDLLELYRRREYAPLWNDRSAVIELRAAIDEAARQGLEPRDYHPEVLDPDVPPRRRGGREDAELDLLRSDALVRLALDIRFGRTRDANRSDELRLDAAAIVSAIETKNLRGYLASLQPRTEIYDRLQGALAAFRRIEEQGGWPKVPEGPALKPGARDPRLDTIRRLLEITGDLPPGSSFGDTYDRTLVDAVRLFQSRHGLEYDGVVGPKTLEAMNVPVARRIEQLRMALERCRLSLRDLPERFVLVNIAGYRVMLFEGGRVTWRARVIVGTPYNETPEFRTRINAVIVNPTWTIPKSIVEKEILPDSRRDPGYFQRKRISRVGDDYVQAAGPGNALGRLKLSMPNEHSVYLHDTPTKSLFDRSKRTFSHGCVRVETPVELASLVLADPQWTVKAIEAEIAKGKTRRLPLATPVPVFIQYWTVTVNKKGVVEFLPDIYGRDEALMRRLATSRTCR